MRIYRFKREQTLSSHNFGQYQVYVCTISNVKGEMLKGISVLRSDSIIELPFPLTKEQALELSEFLVSVGRGEVPKAYKLKGGWKTYFSGLHFRFSTIKDEMLKGRISMTMLLSGHTVWVTVKPSSVLACALALDSLYHERET